MKLLYLECNMGAAGDMLSAALLDLMPEKQAALDMINAAMPQGVSVSFETRQQCGVCGTHITVLCNGEEEHSEDVGTSDQHSHEHHHEHHSHHHASLGDIHSILASLNITPQVREAARNVYQLIASAESKVHGTTVDKIHFHEVGNLDAVADIVMFCLLLDRLAPDKIIVSPVNVGSGFVKCAHGILPVPAPATAELLKGLPYHTDTLQAELCTPTGAALLRCFGNEFGSMPVMNCDRIGYGLGTKEFPRANCVRAFFGQAFEQATESITILECCLDDMTGEDIGFATEQLFAAGARDVFTVPIGMKKNRPAVMLKCIAMPQDADKLAALIMLHTTTAGIRRLPCERYVLSRETRCVETPYGAIRMKNVSGMGVKRSKAEFEDLAAAARNHSVSIETVRRAAETAAENAEVCDD